MGEPIPSLEEPYKRLTTWSGALVQEIDNCHDQIREALNPDTTLPAGCPSHAAMARLVFRSVEKKLHEVNAAAQEVRDVLAALEVRPDA